MEVIDKVIFATFDSMFDLLVIVICKKAVFHRMSLAIEKSVPVWRSRAFSSLFQLLRQYRKFSYSLVDLKKKVINCHQTDLHCEI
jgi:hypothetical protein